MDVPADILKATDAVFDTVQENESLWHAVARALLAERMTERERCARIAENSRCDTSGDKRRADAIAAGIRT